jgi:hypothetical protein
VLAATSIAETLTRRSGTVSLAVVQLILLAACTTSPAAVAPASSHPVLGISNGTTLAVTLVVNGRHVGDYSGVSGGTIELAALPPLPWAVEAQTASG